jgi:hypothetical protein
MASAGISSFTAFGLRVKQMMYAHLATLEKNPELKVLPRIKKVYYYYYYNHQLQATPFISVMTDGTQDISVTEQEIVYVRFAKNGRVEECLISVEAVGKADADGILVAINRLRVPICWTGSPKRLPLLWMDQK